MMLISIFMITSILDRWKKPVGLLIADCMVDKCAKMINRQSLFGVKKRVLSTHYVLNSEAATQNYAKQSPKIIGN